MSDFGETRRWPFWQLKAMYLMRPPETLMRVRVRMFDGLKANGRVIAIENGMITVRADSGMIMEGVRPEWVEHAEIRKP